MFQRYVALGDSGTEGVGDDSHPDGSERGWADRLAEVLAEANPQMLYANLAVRGVHRGSSLYIGQLVPGGRLDITALGDAVNECARIQDCADPHQTLASKQMLEHLSPDDAAGLGIDADKIRYRPLAQIEDANEKAIAVAGAIPITAP